MQRIERFVTCLEAAKRQPTRFEGEKVMTALVLLSAGDLEEAREAIYLAENPHYALPQDLPLTPARCRTIAQLRDRLQLVRNDAGIAE